MDVFLHVFSYLSLSALFFSISLLLIRHPIKLGKVTSIATEFNIWLSFHNRIQIIFNFWILHTGNVSWLDRIWQVSEWNVVSNSKTLVDSILFLICKFIKHRSHIWNFIMCLLSSWALLHSLTTVIIKFCFKHIIFFINGIKHHRITYKWTLINCFCHFILNIFKLKFIK